MNILHHKSWHVRNKNNIAKVREDERKAKEEEEAKGKRRLIAESEARINLLRTKVRKNNPSLNGAAQIAALLDRNETSSVNDDRRNKEHEEEAKNEKEKWEKKLGILTCLGEGCSEVEKPWYLLDHGKRMFQDSGEETSSQNRNQFNINNKHDPLVDMQRYLDIMKKNKSKQEVISISSKSNTLKPSTAVGEDKQHYTTERKRKKEKKSKSKKKKKHKKHKSRHERSKRPSFSSDSCSSSEESEDESDKLAKLEALRTERIRREKAERERAHKLLNKDVKPEPILEVDDRKRGYNSQFNPHLAKQNNNKN